MQKNSQHGPFACTAKKSIFTVPFFGTVCRCQKWDCKIVKIKSLLHQEIWPAQIVSLFPTLYVFPSAPGGKLSSSPLVDAGCPVCVWLKKISLACSIFQKVGHLSSSRASCAKCGSWPGVAVIFFLPLKKFCSALLGRPVFACLIFLDFFGPKNRPFWMTGRSKSRPNDHLLDSWAGTSACDRPGIPPSPPKQRSKCRCCKESLSYFSQSLFGGVQGNVPKFEKLWRIRFQSNHFGWNNSTVNFCYFASKK